MPSPRLASVMGAQPDDRPGGCYAPQFAGRHVGRMDQAPALVHRYRIEQPLDRARMRPGKTIGNFLLLLGDVDMDRAFRNASQRVRQLLKGDSAQGMGREAKHRVWQLRQRFI